MVMTPAENICFGRINELINDYHYKLNSWELDFLDNCQLLDKLTEGQQDKINEIYIKYCM